jgi:hypothetical protein
VTSRDTLAQVLALFADDPTEQGFVRAIIEHPYARAAALTYLRARHVDGVAATEAWEDSAVFDALLALLLATGDEPVARELVALALDVPHPPRLRFVGELLRSTLEPERLARELRTALAADPSPARRRRCDDLIYVTFDAAGAEYTLPPTARAALDAALRGPVAS